MKRFFPSSSDSSGDEEASSSGVKRQCSTTPPLSASCAVKPQSSLLGSSGAVLAGFAKVTPQGSLHESSGAVRAGSSAVMPQGSLPQFSGAAHDVDWVDFLKEKTADRRRELGQQTRPLVMHTLFSGQNSPDQVLRDLDVKFVVPVAAEKKPHARRFCAQNGLAPSGHYFTDVAPLVSIGKGPCSTHGGEQCSLPHEKADLLVAGFPCTPFSFARSGARDKESVRRHPDFEKMVWTIDYILITRPRMFLLENVPGFAGKDSELKDSGGHSFYDDLKKRFEESDYAVDHSFLELGPWIEAGSTRLYAFGAETSEGSDALCRDASRMAYQLQRLRTSAGCPKPWRSCLVQRGSHEWLQAEACWLAAAVSHQRRLPEEQETEESEESWQKQCADIRARWQRAGFTWHAAEPWSEPLPGMATPEMLGIPRPLPSRKAEILNLGVLWAMEQQCLQKLTVSNVLAATQGLICNTTQNPKRHPFAHGVRRLCRTSRLYSYEYDRLLVPSELYRIYGWKEPNLSGLSMAKCVDLLGDSMALPTLGVALVSLIFTAGHAIPDLWQ